GNQPRGLQPYAYRKRAGQPNSGTYGRRLIGEPPSLAASGRDALRRYFLPSAPSTAERTTDCMRSTKMCESNAAARRSHAVRMRSRSATVVDEIDEATAAAVGGPSHP